MKKQFIQPTISISFFVENTDVILASTQVLDEDNGMGWIWGNTGRGVL